MPDNPFDDLLAKFQDAERRYAFALWFFLAVPASDMAKRGKRLRESLYWLGDVPNGLTGKGDYSVFVPKNEVAENGRLGKQWDDPIDDFWSLALEAGARLPAWAWDDLGVRPGDPISTWLCVMWKWSPPITDRSDEFKCWLHPFRDAGHAIERCGLCTSHRTIEAGQDKRKPARRAPRLSRPQQNEIKITQEIAEIYREYRTDPKTSLRKLGAKYKRSHTTIGKIVNAMERQRATATLQASRRLRPQRVPTDHYGQMNVSDDAGVMVEDSNGESLDVASANAGPKHSRVRRR